MPISVFRSTVLYLAAAGVLAFVAPVASQDFEAKSGVTSQSSQSAISVAASTSKTIALPGNDPTIARRFAERLFDHHFPKAVDPERVAFRQFVQRVLGQFPKVELTEEGLNVPAGPYSVAYGPIIAHALTIATVPEYTQELAKEVPCMNLIQRSAYPVGFRGPAFSPPNAALVCGALQFWIGQVTDQSLKSCYRTVATAWLCAGL